MIFNANKRLVGYGDFRPDAQKLTKGKSQRCPLGNTHVTYLVGCVMRVAVVGRRELHPAVPDQARPGGDAGEAEGYRGAA
jgi:hypothetical protein